MRRGPLRGEFTYADSTLDGALHPGAPSPGAAYTPIEPVARSTALAGVLDGNESTSEACVPRAPDEGLFPQRPLPPPLALKRRGVP